MQKISVFSVLLTKLLFLGCVSFMGVFNGSVFAERPPCHKVIVAVDQSSTEGCDACLISEDVWSQSFVSEAKSQILEAKTLLVDSDVFLGNFSKEFVFIQELSSPDPPLDKWKNTWLEAKETIVLVI